MNRPRSSIPQPKRPLARGRTPPDAVAQANAANLNAAVALHQQGQLDQAEVLYQEILKSQPQHFDALQLLATIAAQRKNSEAAVELFDQALEINPDHAGSHCNRGMALRELKRPQEALESYDRALRIKPDYAEALNNRGAVLLDLKRHEEALDSYDQVLIIKPGYAEAHYNRGKLLRELKRNEEALESYDRALKITPDNAEALNNRGAALYDLQRYEEALESYDRALKIKPDHAVAFYNRGNVLRDLKRPGEALESYDRALKIKPDYAEALSNRGNALRDLKRPGEALKSYDRALKIKPDYAEALSNRGNALRDLQRPGEALKSYDHALKIKPDYAEALNNRGAALLDLNRHEEALASYDRAIKIKPDYADAHLNEGICRLLTGDLDFGWKKYEWRGVIERLAGKSLNFAQPQWMGEQELAGKTIFLHAEQGFGDTLQFCRYAPMVAARGAHVVLGVQPELKEICRSLASVDTLLSSGDVSPPFDFHVPLMSLPLALGTRLDSIPAEVPYLYAEPKRVAAWHDLLGPRTKPRVGLAWSGSTVHKNDHNRSLPFARLVELIDDSAEFICLQKEFRDEDAEHVRQHPKLRIVSERLNDFADTAALIETLDLVISVDTSVAHLAGAMGKTVWILLPFAPDWRWLLDREDSPWYPSARLFRQPQFDQWAPVVAEVRQALREYPAYPPRVDADDTAKATAHGRTGGQHPEIKRRHAAIEAKQTDLVRWADAHQMEPAWEKRAEFAARYIPAGARVLDLGCGAMTLEKHLPPGCTYLPCDIVARDSRTRLCDLNRGEFPEDLLQSADVVVILGVLEYIFDVPGLLVRPGRAGRPLLISYCPSDNGLATPRNDLGWVNHYTLEAFAVLLRQAGFQVRRCDPVDGVQWLFHADVNPLPVPLPAKRVLVLSYNNVGNFGDRLGYHLIHSVLPPQAVVTHAHFKPWDVPIDDFDLLVLGIGNSLFAPLLTDELLALLDRIPRKIGIFGTQYRADIPDQRLQAVLDRLDHWYARYGEDVLLYGRGRDNVTHLGDWLINAFPMASGKDERMLKIGQEVWKNLPLDRTIQKIQAHRRVYSTRLHPLLCALTSAETVAYVEQRENSAATSSGKFRSMLLDVFGREMPEEQFWDVDRDAVTSYKTYVMGQTGLLCMALAELV